MLKILLLPFALIYQVITDLRNLLYDKGVLKSEKFKIKSICIGNLQVGGSGKTPMTAWLFQYLNPKVKTSILSRGYGRKTKGLIAASPQSNASEIGDEPYWYYSELQVENVVVSEKRSLGLQYLQDKNLDLVLLDDAFQHRSVACNLHIMLSDFSSPFFKDLLLPAGRLRESRKGSERADIIIFTKCPNELSQAQIDSFVKKCPKNVPVMFTGLRYKQPYPFKGNAVFSEVKDKGLFAFSGLAKPETFYQEVQNLGSLIGTKNFRDHKDYQKTDILDLFKQAGESILICTEKDAVKLKLESLNATIPENKLFVLPVEPYFIRESDELILKQKLDELLG